MNTLETAKILQSQGIACIPVEVEGKRPVVAWKDYQSRIPTDAELAQWFPKNGAMAICAGAIQCIDIDEKNEPGLSKRFGERCRFFGCHDILEKTILQKTVSGGYHLVFRSTAPERRNEKLAQNKARLALIETRGAGGYFLVSPSPGYALLRGDWANIPALTAEEEDALLSAARSLHELPGAEPAASSGVGDVTPGDDYDARCDLPALLRAHGWTSRNGKHWTRAGKSKGTSATWDCMDKKGRFYVFSTSTEFEAGHCYRPWHVYAVLEHGGNFAQAAKQLRREGYGKGDARKSPATGQMEQGQGAVEAAIPASDALRIYTYDEEEDENWTAPPELIQGCLYMGAKGMLAGPSKARKTYLLTDLAVSVASGTPWLGMPTTQTPVLYVNLELQNFAFLSRRREITKSKLAEGVKPLLLTVHGRGHRVNFAMLHDAVARAVKSEGVGLVIVDPVYKLNQGMGDENNAGDVGKMLNDFEALTQETKAALFFAHHYAKGTASAKDSIDRASGSGVFARDPDALLMFSQHSEEGCMVVESHLRNFSSVDPFVVRWNYPLWERDLTLDPADLKESGKRKKNAKEDSPRKPNKRDVLLAIMEACGISQLTRDNVSQVASQMGCSERSVWNYWRGQSQ